MNKIALSYALKRNTEHKGGGTKSRVLMDAHVRLGVSKNGRNGAHVVYVRPSTFENIIFLNIDSLYEVFCKTTFEYFLK